MDISAAVSGYRVSGDGGGRYVRPRPPEYRLPVYRHLNDPGAMTGGREMVGRAGVNEMVETGRTETRSEGFVDAYGDRYIDGDRDGDGYGYGDRYGDGDGYGDRDIDRDRDEEI